MKDQTNITTMKDLAITLKQNKPGELAKAVSAISKAQVNIEGFTEIDGKFHCVTDDPKSAQKALESAGFSVSETDVLVFTAEDRPGYLANVLRGITEQEVNVITSYVLTNYTHRSRGGPARAREGDPSGARAPNGAPPLDSPP